jgi:hypothetical protein
MGPTNKDVLIAQRNFALRMRSYLERGWCQTVSARDADGTVVKSTDPGAACWCVFGAWQATRLSPQPPADCVNVYTSAAEIADLVWSRLLGITPASSPIAWNDREGRTQEDMLSLIDKLIVAIDKELEAHAK